MVTSLYKGPLGGVGAMHYTCILLDNQIGLLCSTRKTSATMSSWLMKILMQKVMKGECLVAVSHCRGKNDTLQSLDITYMERQSLVAVNRNSVPGVA